jgi:hypothetical protein
MLYREYRWLRWFAYQLRTYRFTSIFCRQFTGFFGPLAAKTLRGKVRLAWKASGVGSLRPPPRF